MLEGPEVPAQDAEAQVALLAATIGAFAFMLSCLWATLRVTFVGVPESVPKENRAEESAEVRSPS